MNLETFKARARRKLELPPNNLSTGQPARDANQAATTTTATGGNDVFAAALRNASATAADTSPAVAPGANTPVATTRRNSGAASLQSHTGSKARPASSSPDVPDSSSTQSDQTMFAVPAASDAEFAMQTRTERRAPRTTDHTTSSDEQLQHLRSLLLGSSQESQQDQVDVVYRRTQAGLSTLRRDMDAKITDLSEYIEQLEQSVLNSMESHTGGFDERSYEELSRTITAHDERLDALDSRLDKVLSELRTEFEEKRVADRDDVNQQILAANDRTDQLLAAVSERLEGAVAGLQTNISEQFDALIDPRVSELSGNQDASLAQLREMLLDNTGAIKAELKSQTEDQANQLKAHRTALEIQFNDAIKTLNNNKVSHRDLSQLLSRLADRIQQL